MYMYIHTYIDNAADWIGLTGRLSV